MDNGGLGPRLVPLVVSGLVILFSMWWLYFGQSAEDLLTSLRAAIAWGYGHYVIFAAAGAVGSGLAVAVDYLAGGTKVSARVAGYAVAVPVAVYLLSVWVLHVWPHQRRPVAFGYPAAALLVLAAPWLGLGIPLVAVVLAVLVAVTVVAPGRPANRPAG